jgi:hypothetical protein
MKHLIKGFRISCILFIILATSSLLYAASSNSKPSFQLCSHKYALCTGSRCIPQPGNPNLAICPCTVEEGLSVATVACNTLRPVTDNFGVRTIFSTFSFLEFECGNKALHCPDGTPWTNCLNQRCTVDPSDPCKAICICEIVRSGNWFTAGGDCEQSTCATGYWSGALDQDLEPSSAFLMKALGLIKSPIRSCPRNL